MESLVERVKVDSRLNLTASLRHDFDGSDRVLSIGGHLSTKHDAVCFIKESVGNITHHLGVLHRCLCWFQTATWHGLLINGFLVAGLNKFEINQHVKTIWGSTQILGSGLSDAVFSSLVVFFSTNCTL